ncbi:hypothetical protein V3C99_016022 [Haemonchus contortus]
MYENLSYSQFLSFGMFLVGHHCHCLSAANMNVPRAHLEHLLYL